jgi:S-layer protein (TIGR01567 family)
MAEKYFAGFTRNSVISNGQVKSTLGNNQLHKVLLDDEDKRIAYEGGTLTLKEGYVLKMKEVDVGAGPGQVWIVLLKDGTEVDNGVLSGNANYVYSKKVGSESDLPIIAVHFDSVFRGREVNAAFIRGIFQISESFTSIKTGDRYGELEISSVGAGGIVLSNEHSIYLSSGNTIDLVGDLKLVVANSDVLRFALSVQKTGTFEARGTIYPKTNEWTPRNFGLNVGGTNAGFYYDMDHDIGKEDLKIETVSGDSIPDGRLRYSATSENVDFDYSGFGKYNVIGFMADKYFAGYSRGGAILNEEKNLLGRGQLQKILFDDETKYTVSGGGTLTLKEGYILKIKDVDVGAGEGQVLIALLKDGTEIDSDVVSGHDTYVYSKKVGNVSDLPIIAVHFDSVFRGREVNAAFVRGIFQISESSISVKAGDRYGEMEITRIDASGIEMRNTNSISLPRGGTVDLMGNIKFKVADSGDVRLYPFIMVTPDMVSAQLSIDAPVKATAGDIITIKVTAGDKPVEGASVAIALDTKQTDKYGVLNYTLKRSMKGIYNITVTDLGYQKASRGLEVQGYMENRLSIDSPPKANQFGVITILVRNKELPVAGAVVRYDGADIGQTDDSGALKYTLETSGIHAISASKSGYATAARDLEVLMPFTEYKALDIDIIPQVVIIGQEATITSNVTNAGTNASPLPVALIINDTEVNTQPVNIAPGEVAVITFKQKVSFPVGNYTVEVLGQKKLLEVRESPPLSIFMVIGMIIAPGAIIIYLLTAKKKIGFEALRKFAAKQETGKM